MSEQSALVSKLLLVNRDLMEQLSPEMITGVAIRYIVLGGPTYVLNLPRPHRHHNIITACRTTISWLRDQGAVETQGFITTLGRFVDRESGLFIANKANQVKHKHPSYSQLYSEDMW